MPGLSEKVPQSPDSLSFVRPQCEDEPLMQILEHRETERCEAAFAIELAGVVFRGRNGSEREGKSLDSRPLRLAESVLAGMEAGEGIEFVYRCGEGVPFTWRVFGRVERDAAAGAVARAHELYSSLSSGMRAMGADYRFLPVREEGGLQQFGDGQGWQGRVVSKGMTVRADRRNPIGFRKAGSTLSVDRVVMLPDLPPGSETQYNRLGRILHYSTIPLELRLSLTQGDCI